MSTKDPTLSSTPQEVATRTEDPARPVDATMLEAQYYRDVEPQHLEGRRAAVERIRRRDPEYIARNAKRATTGIETLHLRQAHQAPVGILQGMRNTKALRRLHDKARRFGDAFEKTVFSAITHGTTNDLGPTAELKSPERLAEETGSNALQAAKTSGLRDFIIGNTNYVFANSAALPSRSNITTNQYRIDAEEGFVVPIDIADFRTTGQQLAKSGNYETMLLEIYGDNIYTIKDFKQVFALYNAALFDTPKEALEFHKKFNTQLADAGVWESLDKEQPEEEWLWAVILGVQRANRQERNTLLLMRELLDEFGVYPPSMPEFQYRHEVHGERITQG